MKQLEANKLKTASFAISYLGNLQIEKSNKNIFKADILIKVNNLSKILYLIRQANRL